MAAPRKASSGASAACAGAIQPTNAHATETVIGHFIFLILIFAIDPRAKSYSLTSGYIVYRSANGHAHGGAADATSGSHTNMNVEFRNGRIGASAWVLALAVILPAWSQAPASNDAAKAREDGLDEVLVTGIRGSLTSAIEKKRKSRQIVESVVAEDVGKLPDNNVPE